MMVPIEELEEYLNRCVADLLRYEEGDLMLVSGVLDGVEKIEQALRPFPRLVDVAGGLRKLLEGLFEGAVYGDIEPAVSAGFDLLGRFARTLKSIGTAPAVEADIERDFSVDISRLLERLPIAAADGPIRRERPKAEAGPAPARDEAFRIFLTEAGGRIVGAQNLILDLEKNPDDRGSINELFRAFHTIKGECGFLQLASLGELAHHLETLLDFLRGGSATVDTMVIDLLLDGIDIVRSLLDALGGDDTGAADRINTSDYAARLAGFIHHRKANIGEILLEQGKLTGTEVSDILRKQRESNFKRKFGEIAIDEHYLTPHELDESLGTQRDAAKKTAGGGEEIVKVRSSRVNYLVDMVGELMIIESQLDESSRHMAQLKKITREIQAAAMQLRTEKVQGLFINMKRVARDAARRLDKRVTTVFRGEGLEIDRDLVERLEEPLVHLVRNAIGHGIESERERLKAGKPAEGRLLLEAERRGNTIVIAVEDDGRGLDREKILAKAVEKGLVAAEEAPRLSNAEVFGFIFREGFSTAESVDLVSGRGVGMDIVKSAAAAARGRVEIRTERGARTRTELVFPLSTAIIDGMIVRSAGTAYVIPVADIVESVRVDGTSVHGVGEKAEVFDLRGEIVPVIRLDEFYGRDNGADAAGGAVAVIVGGGDRSKLALLVDEIIAKREVFIKTLGAKFSGLPGISSGTILPGGSIGFVLDTDDIIRRAGAGALTARSHGGNAACVGT